MLRNNCRKTFNIFEIGNVTYKFRILSKECQNVSVSNCKNGFSKFQSINLSPTFNKRNEMPYSGRVIERRMKKVTPLTRNTFVNGARYSVCGFKNATMLLTCSAYNTCYGERKYHNDIITPNFDEHRRSDCLDPNQQTSVTNESKKILASVASAAIALPSIYVVKNSLRAVASSFNLPGDILALSNSEIDISEIKEGKCITVTWRNQPVFVHHRTPAQIELARSMDLKALRDPEHDDDRIVRPEWLVTLAVCTHLGCVPLYGKGDYHGYFCPCHGSHYDTSGRIRQGPAPLNLEVPEHRFPDDNTLDIGPPLT
ncbi:hypothetical protein A3Q56_05449 [Intoshia linei]|uniref:Rieske domain-containing protein n=1 Tax=Intoshia linei TaxID=1819745 RepID=A0A177AXU5_9BILA|nr:hypothetical protein A3Q56_05449 [Intoshia linei]